MITVEASAAPDMQRESDFLDGVAWGVAYVLQTMRGCADELDTLKNPSAATAFRNFAAAVDEDTNDPSLYSDAYAEWMDRQAQETP